MIDHQAVWRGNAVKVLHADNRHAVIVTPCDITYQVRQAELQPVSRRRKVKRDAKKF